MDTALQNKPSFPRMYKGIPNALLYLQFLAYMESYASLPALFLQTVKILINTTSRIANF